MTFRQLLAKVQAECPEKLYACLFSRDKDGAFRRAGQFEAAASDLRNSKSDLPESRMGEVTPELTAKSYSRVIQELLKKPRSRAYRYPILVRMTRQGGESYADVSLFNTKAVPPPKGLRPWGGKPPKGYYNCNLSKYSPRFAFGYTSWSKIIDTPVVNRARLKNHELLAVILWELTFNGWTEEQCRDSVQVLKEKLDEARKGIKAGKCIVLPRKGEKGFNPAIPDSVRDSRKTES
jgi:hypothetical protein